MKVPLRWVSTTGSHSASTMLKNIRSRRMPATVTTPSMRPNVSTALWTIGRAALHRRHRARVGDGVAAGGADRVHDLVGDLAGRLVAVDRHAVVVHHDRGALARAELRGGAADATSRARDRDHLAVERAHQTSGREQKESDALPLRRAHPDGAVVVPLEHPRVPPAAHCHEHRRPDRVGARGCREPADTGAPRARGTDRRGALGRGRRMGAGPRRPRAPPSRGPSDGRRRAPARSTATPGKLDARARVDHLLDPGSFHELGTLVGGEDAPADAVVMGSGRIDGRPVMVAAEDFTVKAGTISAAANAKRYRVAELAVADRVPLVMMLEGAGLPGRRARPRRAHADRPARPGAVLRPRPARDRGARRVGRARRARRADVRLRGDEPRTRRSSPPVRRSCSSRSARRSPRRTSAVRGRARERPDPQRRRRRRRRARPGARATSRYFPSSAWSYPPTSTGGDDGPRLVPEILDIVPAQRPAHLRHAPGRSTSCSTPDSVLRGPARLRRGRSSARSRASAAIPSRSSRTSRTCWPARSTPTPPTRRRTSSPSPTRSTCRWCSCPTTRA